MTASTPSYDFDVTINADVLLTLLAAASDQKVALTHKLDNETDKKKRRELSRQVTTLLKHHSEGVSSWCDGVYRAAK